MLLRLLPLSPIGVAKPQDTPRTSQVTATVYVAWNLWTERNRRILKNETISVEGVVALIRVDIEAFEQAYNE